MKRLKLVKSKMEENPDKAAVLVPLCMYNDKLGFLYTLRSKKVKMNQGQVCFPGGKVDEIDKNLEETALRETWEELKIPRESVDIWGIGNFIGRKNLSVYPVIGYIGKIDPTNLMINTQEVEEAFVYPLEKLCDPSYCRYTQFKNNYTLPTYLGEKHKIWGLTAIITHIVMSALLPDVYTLKLPYAQLTDDKELKSNYTYK